MLRYGYYRVNGQVRYRAIPKEMLKKLIKKTNKKHKKLYKKLANNVLQARGE